MNRLRKELTHLNKTVNSLERKDTLKIKNLLEFKVMKKSQKKKKRKKREQLLRSLWLVRRVPSSRKKPER